MFTGNKKRKKILIIISLISYNNKDFLTLTSIYIQHLLRLKSLKKIINNKHDTESLFKVPLLVPELSKHVHNTFFIAALPNKRSSLLDKKLSSCCLYLKSVGIFYLALKTNAFFNLLIIEQSQFRHV